MSNVYFLFYSYYIKKNMVTQKNKTKGSKRSKVKLNHHDFKIINFDKKKYKFL